MHRETTTLLICALCGLLLSAGCGGSPEAEAGGRQGPPRGDGQRGGPGGGPGGRGGPGGFGGPPAEEKGVPVEVATAVRQPIAAYFETNGVLEAENEVDLVARLAGPVLELATEEGRRVGRGQLLARIDGREIEAQLAASRVLLEEARLSYDRVKALHEKELVSRESFDQALSRFEGARAEVERLEVQLGYTEVRAPFAGLIVERYVKLAETVSVGTPLFRLSDFEPLLCPIQVPEKELPRLARGQRAELEVEAFPGERFAAEVLRIQPVVDAATGTVKVTLEVEGSGRLRPGMFASVYLEMERREDALVIPKAALALDSLGDAVFVADRGMARRRNLRLGFQSDDLVEVESGLDAGEAVVVVGQDGLSDGTPIEILAGPGAAERPAPAASGPADRGAIDPQMLEAIRARMRARGFTDEQIEERLQAMRERGGPGAGADGPPRGGPGRMTPEQLEAIKARMRARGLTDEQIEERLQAMRRRAGAGSS